MKLPDDKVEAFPKFWKGKSLLGEVKNVMLLERISIILSNRGFEDVGVSYMGGMKILLIFRDKEEAIKFMKEKDDFWSEFLLSMTLWQGKEWPMERIAQLFMTGIPVMVRGELVIDDIGSLFGRVVEKSNFSWNEINNATCSCRVLCDKKDRIYEIINLEWDNAVFPIRVVESESWWTLEFKEASTENLSNPTNIVSDREEGEFRRGEEEEELATDVHRKTREVRKGAWKSGSN